MFRMEISGKRRLFAEAVSENIIRVVYTGQDEVQNHSSMVEYPVKTLDLQKEEGEGNKTEEADANATDSDESAVVTEQHEEVPAE